jgi:ADP-ribosylglycohydrolase
MTSLPPDYLERVYAGVLGKLIGVYVGRPFENWTHQRILKELGPIKHYVHEKLNMPLVVTDDDISGTFTFVRALEEHGVTSNLSSEDIGKSWLNNVIESRSVFWWGGRGLSTEHTAFLNLKQGIPAPRSGSKETNGITVAEQIGAQIFIDGWAMVAPGNPALAAKLAQAAGSVSHDGEAVYAAVLWAAMEAEAFVSRDIDHLLDTGLRFIPPDSSIAALVNDIRDWVKADKDWLTTRQRIEDIHGYEKYHGCCHVMPNHAIMIMAILYAGHDFHEAMHIINTSGWDTDCNSGNVGCLVALINGLDTFEGGPDWRGPLADRALISSADGGYSINNAARIAFDIANLGRQLAGATALQPPKAGAQYHFTLPGSVQGFQVTHDTESQGLAKITQSREVGHEPGLAIHLAGLSGTTGPVEVLTPTFTPRDVLQMGPIYPLMACPLVYPGQTIKAVLRSGLQPHELVNCRLRLKAYGQNDEPVPLDSPEIVLSGGETKAIDWTILDELDSQPIQQVGILLSVEGNPIHGVVWLDSLRWSGTPRMVLQRPSHGPGDFWHRAWVNGVDHMHQWMKPSFSIAQNIGEGMISIGTRDWTDYRATAFNFKGNFGKLAGVAVRVQGVNRYYAVMFTQDNGISRLALVKAQDEQRVEMVSKAFDWHVDDRFDVTVIAQGTSIQAHLSGTVLEAKDETYSGGGLGLIAVGGSLAVDKIEIMPA